MSAGSTSKELIAYVDGIGLWTPRLPGWHAARAILRGEANAPREPIPRPVPVILAANERRRAPDSVAVALHVAERACDAARSRPRDLTSVFASTFGDCAVNDAVCAQLARAPLDTSPTKFHHSVHNAAAGYWAIATGCLEPYTALTAYRHTFGTGLLAAVASALVDETRVLYVAYDSEATGPLASMAQTRGLMGGALVLGVRPSQQTVARLALSLKGRESFATPVRSENEVLVAGNAMAGSLVLFEALADEVSREILLTLGRKLALRVGIAPFESPDRPSSEG